ncbi:hypothetical protein H261_08278 [Paramagnetospirillum caucaseum]|uniref:Uncharacterized protein n=1 Tax=Paramagnetospirillum caucaseum TaxID=1244869 RepID=M3AD81_9PROT|nr:hypothetical protein H261_08278 [Paramagnetospirillum caucaseum]
MHIPALANTREHPRLGCPTFAGITLSEAAPSAEAFFTSAGVLKAALTGAQATAAIIAEIAALAGEVEAARARTERPIADAARFTSEAGLLADMPLVGNERATIMGFASMIAAALEGTAINSGTTSPVTFFKSVRHLAHGLDGKGIDAAVQSFDRALAGHEAATTKLKAAHAKLLELAALADDGANRDRVSMLKASIDFKRRLPQALDELAAGREQVVAALARFDLALTTLKECA